MEDILTSEVMALRVHSNEVKMVHESGHGMGQMFRWLRDGGSNSVRGCARRRAILPITSATVFG